MNAIILCGGLSTRLGERTKHVPKVLLPIGPKTVLEWQLEKIKQLGISEVVLAAGHLAEVLQKEVGDICNGVKLIYAIEKERLGTGGAIKHGLTSVSQPQAPTLVFNGDVLTTLSVAGLVASLRPETEGVILGTKVEDSSTYGTIQYDSDHRITAFLEKEGKKEPAYINGGIYLFTPHIATSFPAKDSFSIEYEVFPQTKNLYVYLSDEPWIDIGIPDRLAFAENYWQQFEIAGVPATKQ